jgi:hypothetical protein
MSQTVVVVSRCRSGASSCFGWILSAEGILVNPQPFSKLPSWCVTGSDWKPWPRNFLGRLFGGLRSFLAQRRASFRRQVRDCLFRFRRSSCFLNVLLGRKALSQCSHRSLSLSFTVIFQPDTLPASTSVSDPWQVTPIVLAFLLVYFLPDRMALVYRICRRAIVFAKTREEEHVIGEFYTSSESSHFGSDIIQRMPGAQSLRHHRSGRRVELWIGCFLRAVLTWIVCSC